MNYIDKKRMAYTIQDLRLEKNLTQEQLAQKLGISYSSVVAYENGLRQPNSKAMAALERFFGVTGAYLRGEEARRVQPIKQINEDSEKENYPSDFEEQLVEMLDTEPETKAFFEMALTLSDAERKELLKLAKAWLSVQDENVSNTDE